VVDYFFFVNHSKFVHDARRSPVFAQSDCYDAAQFKPPESITQNHLGGLRCEPLTPNITGEPPANFDAWQVVKRLESAKTDEAIFVL
jgi:hypothetical protein